MQTSNRTSFTSKSPFSFAEDHAMSGLVSYGGDETVVATRAEIERITSDLSAVQRRLLDEIKPMAQLNGVVHHLQLDLMLPETLVRLGLQRHGCFVAAESYFTTDARVAHQLDKVAETLHDNPWLTRLIPKEVWVGLAATTAVAGFTNTDFTSQVVRATASQIPSEKFDLLTQVLPNERVLVGQEKAAVLPTPSSVFSLTQRLNNDSGNIRIEGYQTQTGRVLVVYLPGTANWSPIGGSSAFDLRSNLELLGDSENSNSTRAANAALQAYGVKPSDRLVLVGYSQGGMVAAHLADNNSQVVGLVTIGAPIANEKLPAEVAVLSIEHSNDLVPALAGSTNPFTENWATATRHWEISAGESVIESHDINAYANTAELVDSSTDRGLIRIKHRILGSIEASEALEAKEYRPLKAAS
jgi:hypothetical protein